MKKTGLFLLMLCVIALAQAQPKAIKITYQSSYNEKPILSAHTVMEISGTDARISYVASKPQKDSPTLTTYLDYKNNKEIRTALLPSNELIYTTKDFKLNEGLKPQPETEKIAGYNCKKVTTSINSNRMEIWYTTELKSYGSMQPGVALPEGVVLKVIRNGQQEEKAVKVEILNHKLDLAPTLASSPLSAPQFNYKIQQSRVIAVDVFRNQSIYYKDIPKPKQLNDTEVMQFANGTIVLKKVKLPEDVDNYAIFAELTQFSEGDAYDRTGSVFVVPTDRKKSFLDGLMYGKEHLPQYYDKNGDVFQGVVATDDYLPPLELMRFYTSFGVKAFNHIQVANYNWPDSAVFKQEITDYAKILRGEVWIGTWIGNYVPEAHNVTLQIKYYPNRITTDTKEVYPLFTTTNIMEMAEQSYPEGIFRNDSLKVEFQTDKDLENAYIRYISTGHGGWAGGDEFNPKVNEIFVDGTRVMAYTPWREDCGTYRHLNPASGNSPNGLSSSDYSRSGWCPGMVSYPVFIHLGKLKAGKHSLRVAIPVGDAEATSRSYWCISGVLVGNANIEN